MLKQELVIHLALKQSSLDMHQKELKFFGLENLKQEFLVLEHRTLTNFYSLHLNNITEFIHFTGGLYGE